LCFGEGSSGLKQEFQSQFQTGRIPVPMKLILFEQLTQFMRVMQGTLFPTLQEELGPLTEKHRQLVALLDMVRIEALTGSGRGGVGRPEKDRE
jgi:mevalonate kinase